MKTQFATIIAAAALIFTTAANAKTTDNGAVTLSETGHINKIEANGNVEVYITNGKEDGVKVYNNYYAQNAMVQNQDGTLRVSSYNTDALVVLVTVSDLRGINANDHAIIKSYEGQLSALSLDIKLNDSAIASLDLDAVAANISVNDQARADLSGMVENYHLDYSKSSTINKSELDSYTNSERELEQPKHIRAPRGFGITASL